MGSFSPSLREWLRQEASKAAGEVRLLQMRMLRDEEAVENLKHESNN